MDDIINPSENTLEIDSIIKGRYAFRVITDR